MRTGFADGSIAQIVNCTLGKTTQMGLLRGDWLKELNMDAPTTIDEMTDVLRAFKDKYGTTNALLINSDLDSAAEYGLNFSAQGFKMYMGRNETAPALFITLVI